jgi:peroxiredoxin
MAAWLVLSGVAFAQPMAPKVGMKAPDFALKDVAGMAATLSQERAQGAVVLIVGRGWPGYQCPFCTRQFAEFRSHAKELQAAGARVLWIYPGPEDELAKHAADFTGTEPLPSNFRVLIDPGYAFTNAYGLRWNAPKETAYPATFVIDRDGSIRFANVSLEHGGRTPVADVLKALAGPMR